MKKMNKNMDITITKFLDCGLSFGRVLIEKIPGHVSILLLPAAVGGSPVNQSLINE